MKTDGATSERVRGLLASLPDRPGVYVFRDAGGKVLYVGKAKSLRKRVMSYFRSGAAAGSSGRTARMVRRIHDFDFVTTSNETEALLLEANFIKHHRPRYNVMLRDDKSYPYVAVTLNEEFPRVTFTRKPHRTGVAYFGPFAGAARLRETLDLLGKVFPFRKCRGPQPGRRTGSPCLNYHIGLCLAPCAGKVDRESYRRLIGKVERLLSGRPEGLTEELRRTMKEAARAQRYEEAALLRNRLAALKHLIEKQHAMDLGVDSMDAIGIYAEGDFANVQVLMVRDGNLIDRRSFFLENVAGEEASEVLEQFLIHYYSAPIGVPLEVVVPPAVEEIALLEDFLSEQKDSRVRVRRGMRGKRRHLMEMAERNAELALKQDRMRRDQLKGRPARELTALKEALGLAQVPHRIECYDISNIGGQHAVGSMVVFEDGTANPAHYRRFSIRETQGPDDYAMMSEVLSRRFRRRGLLEAEAVGDESFASRPDLLVVDGGAGQVSAAVAALEGLGVTGVPVIGLAKRLEEIYRPGRAQPFRLRADSPALKLLIRLRDEAHRSAVAYHRVRRGWQISGSILDGIPGIGPVRKRAILSHFGSPERFLAAGSDELEAVPGLPAKVAREAYAHVHRLGKD